MTASFDEVLKNLEKQRGKEFAIVHNPSYVYPPVEYYPLAPKLKTIKRLRAAMMDMDGTTTTTEELCIYSLEKMVRRLSGKISKNDWEGLDSKKDYPFIIGNSTTRHVEYLINTYRKMIDLQRVKTEFLAAAAWTLISGPDVKRREEVIQNLKKKGIFEKFESRLIAHDSWADLVNIFEIQGNHDIVNLAIDVYYEEYHRILLRMKNGESEKIQAEVFGQQHSGKHLIAPMPGIFLLLPMLKGWLGEDVKMLLPRLVHEYENATGEKVNYPEAEAHLLKLSLAFEKEPVRLALVTSSIFYEAQIVIAEVLHVVSQFIEESALPDKKKKQICDSLTDYRKVYDAFVTASDSSEIRLKPHRDLYSIALHQAGITPDQFGEVIGFEDSQSGTIAIRAAGIGCCVAVPFAQTSAHNLDAAAHIVKGGIPEVLLRHHLFLE